ncbi:hypothetical protein CsSME_00023718 [Camellia sinensis var. sinensis]
MLVELSKSPDIVAGDGTTTTVVVLAGAEEHSCYNPNFSLSLCPKSTFSSTSTCEFDCRERSEMPPSSQLQAESGELESSARLSEANSGRSLTADKMPSETEIEDFFVAAEKCLQNNLQRSITMTF